MADKDQAEQAAPEKPQDPGEILREAREGQDLSLEEIAADLRIEAHLLEALEAGRYEELGAPVFGRGYIRQYSSRLGLDGADLVERYTAAIGGDDIQIAPSQGIRLRDTRSVGRWIIAALVLAIIAVALLVWWLNEPAPPGREVVSPAPVASTPGDGIVPAGSAAPAESEAVPEPSAAADAGSADATVVDSAPPPRATGSDVAGDDSADADDLAGSGGAVAGADLPAASVPAPAGQATPDAESEPVGQALTAVADRAAAPGADGSVAPDETTAASGPGIDVEIEFTDECWVEISDASGSRLFYGLAEAGDRRVLRGAPPLDVFLGNVDAAAIVVNGREFTVPAQARRGNLARFAIEAD